MLERIEVKELPAAATGDRRAEVELVFSREHTATDLTGVAQIHDALGRTVVQLPTSRGTRAIVRASGAPYVIDFADGSQRRLELPNGM